MEDWNTLYPTDKFVFTGEDSFGEIKGSLIFSQWEIDSRGEILIVNPESGKTYIPVFSDDGKRMTLDIDGDIYVAISIPNKVGAKLTSKD